MPNIENNTDFAAAMARSRSFRFGARDTRKASRADQGPNPRHYAFGFDYGKWCRERGAPVDCAPVETIAAWAAARTDLC